MVSPESDSNRHLTDPKAQQQSPFPEDLAQFLRAQPEAVVCLMQATNRGTAFVIRTRSHEIANVRGQVAVRLRHELYAHSAAPVIRTVLAIYDQPNVPLALESYTNIEDEEQRQDFAALADQEALLLLFYDEALTTN